MDNTLSEQLEKEIEEKAAELYPTGPHIPDSVHYENVKGEEGYIAGATHYALRVQELEEQRDKLLEFAREWVVDVEQRADSVAQDGSDGLMHNYADIYRSELMSNTQYPALKQLIESIKPSNI